MMFKFALAYADQPVPVISQNSDGSINYAHFNRKDFLKIDDAGEPYWNDEFIFETDPTSTLMVNREAMWNQADMKLQSGAFGPVGDLETARLYWTVQKANSYPNAGMALSMIEKRIEEAQEAQEGGMDAVPVMPYGSPYQI
jgi:hypothetical protein